MVRPSLAVGLLLATACAAATGPSQREIFDKYCVTCHNQRLKTGGLTLDTMDLSKVPAQAEVWEKVIRKLRAGHHAPGGMPRPDAATYSDLAGLARNADRSSLPALCRPARPASPESRRIRQRDPRSAGSRYRRRRAASSRRFGVMGSTISPTRWAFAGAAGTLSGRGGENRRAGGGRSA